MSNFYRINSFKIAEKQIIQVQFLQRKLLLKKIRYQLQVPDLIMENQE